MPLLSVIIPVYNAEHYLEDCLESVCGQSFRNMEIICVDDGSTDSSKKILNRVSNRDSRVRVYTKNNGGLSSARNYGIEQASGDFIAFVDADDMVLPSMYTAMIEAMIRFNLDMAGCSFTTYPSGEVKKYSLKTGRIMDFASLLSTDQHIESSNDLCFVWRYLFCRQLIGSVRFREDIRFAEDMIFVTELMGRSEKILLMDMPYYQYRTDNPNSLMRNRCNLDRLEAIPLGWNEKMDQIQRFRMDDYSPCSSDLARYTLRNLLPMMMEALPAEAGKEGIRKIISTEMLCKSCKILGFASPFDNWREYLYYLAVKFRLPALVSRLYFHK